MKIIDNTLGKSIKSFKCAKIFDSPISILETWPRGKNHTNMKKDCCKCVHYKLIVNTETRNNLIVYW